MAYTFTRRPIAGADENTWAPLEQAQNVAVLSIYTAYLFNDSGTLKVTAGNIGMNDGTNFGVSNSTTEQTISIAAVTNGNWAYVLMSVSGASVTFSAVDIAGETDSNSFPSTTVDALWNGARGGFYSASNRILGVIYKGSGGTLDIVYNAEKKISNNNFLKRSKFSIFNSQTTMASLAAGWNTMTLDNTVRNEISGVSISSNQITIPQGVYRINGYCTMTVQDTPSLRGIRIYDATNAVKLSDGLLSYYPDAANDGNIESVFDDIIEIEGEIDIELQVFAVVSDSSGNGTPTDGDFRRIIIERLN